MLILDSTNPWSDVTRIGMLVCYDSDATDGTILEALLMNVKSDLLLSVEAYAGDSLSCSRHVGLLPCYPPEQVSSGLVNGCDDNMDLLFRSGCTFSCVG